LAAVEPAFDPVAFAMTEGYGKWLEQARERGLPREALDDVTLVEQIVEAVAQFLLD